MTMRREGTEAPMNQVIQALGMVTPISAASLRHSRFCAAAVRNIGLLDTCIWLTIRKEPSLLAVLPGREPDASASDLMMGMKMPPERAEVEGIAGEMSTSAIPSPYASPSVDLPNTLTNS
jgi:hypothetical protein